MGHAHAVAELRTHAVENQPPPFEGHNAFANDTALREAVTRYGAGWAAARLDALGAAVGDPANIEMATLANRHEPELRRFDRYGHRVDAVEFHPAWHDTMALAFRHQVGTLPWVEPRPGAHVAKAGASILFNQLEGGAMCPVAITYGVVPMLRQEPALAEQWEALLLSPAYDGRNLPHGRKTGITAAFTATEKQGGSDVRRNATTAEAVGPGGPGGEYRLRGHKWFCSAAGADIIFVVAQTPEGPGCFLVPRWLPDGSRNPISLERLKDKMGNRSNASAELEFDGTRGWLVGEPGRGIPVMMVFMLHTRFEVALAPAGNMRLALTHAIHHARHRSAFQRRLIDQPLMRNVLADLALESEAATALVMRIGHALDQGEADPSERAFARVAVAIAKYWTNKRSVPVIHEAMEAHGGAGYIEESVIPRFYREAPLNGIWEGAGNVICLDVLRALRKDAGTVDALLAELERARGGDRRLDRALGEIGSALAKPSLLAEDQARHVTERLALALQAALLVRHAPSAVADAFCATRLGGEGGRAFGTLPSGADTETILGRALAA